MFFEEKDWDKNGKLFTQIYFIVTICEQMPLHWRNLFWNLSMASETAMCSQVPWEEGLSHSRRHPWLLQHIRNESMAGWTTGAETAKITCEMQILPKQSGQSILLRFSGWECTATGVSWYTPPSSPPYVIWSYLLRANANIIRPLTHVLFLPKREQSF